MCFSEEMSYFNFIILILSSYYYINKPRLASALFFLGIKDLIQGMSYTNIRNNKETRALTALSWIHICFQPFFVNLGMSYFDINNKIWKPLLLICLIYGFYYITKLNEFDIQNDERCNNGTDFCSKTSSYIGKYHLGYKFNLDKNYTELYILIMFLPALFTKARYIDIGWIIFYLIFEVLFNNIGMGERAAIYCFSSILYALPISIFSKQILKLIN